MASGVKVLSPAKKLGQAGGSRLTAKGRSSKSPVKTRPLRSTTKLPDVQVPSSSKERRPERKATKLKLQIVEGNQLLTLSVQADESRYVSSDDDMDQSQPPPTPPAIPEDNESLAESDDTTDSVKILPMTAEERRTQVEDINQEVAAKLQELHGIMSEGGLTNSLEFLKKNFGVIPPAGGMQQKAPQTTPAQDTSARRVIKPIGDVPTGIQSKHHQHVTFNLGLNLNYNHRPSTGTSHMSKSVETIYRNAVEKQCSSSSEEGVNISDETMDLFSDADFQPDYDDELLETEMDLEPDHQQHGTSTKLSSHQGHSATPARLSLPKAVPQLKSPEEIAEDLIIDAENRKTVAFSLAGKDNLNFTAKIDEEYLVVGVHVNETTKTKIIKGEYVDFGKLLLRDCILAEGDSRLELVVRNGKTFWMPVSELVSINGFSKWEQAFQIYSNVYTAQYPHKATKVIQYNHIIHSIAGIYTWENVYSYDK